MNTLSIISFFLCILAWASYLPVAKIPSLRRTMWPTWVLLAVSVAMAAFALGAGKKPVRDNMFSISTFMLAASFAVAYLIALRVPKSQGRPEIGNPISPFQVVGEDGNIISRDTFAGRGPVLLVFFRGFW